MNNSEIKIGIICPLDIEYESCKEVLRLRDETTKAGRFTSTRKENNIKVIAVKAGVGKINCSSATQLIIDQFHPDFVIDAGVAGSLVDNLNIFDIICAEHSFEYDAYSGNTLGKEPKGEDRSSSIFSDLSYHKSFKGFINQIQITMGITLIIGSIASGEKDVNDRRFRKTLNKNFNALACNWETSAVLKVAQLNNLKGLSFRVIVDNANEDMENTFNKHCSPALKKLFRVLSDFIFNGWIYNFY